MTNKITELFKKREEQFEATTVEVIDLIENVTDAIEEFMVATGVVTTEEVVWTEVGMASPEMLILIGYAFVTPGQTFTTGEGESLTITDENEANFRRLLRVGIPLDVASSNNKETVLTFLQKSSENRDQQTSEFEEHLEQVAEQLSTKAEEENVTKGFDLDQLSEEQRKALEMFSSTGKH